MIQRKDHRQELAIWIENLDTGQLKTVFVTYRSAAGDWEGKLEVPVALPMWYEIYKKENSKTEIPTYKNPAPVAITGATPKAELFRIRAEVEPASRWVCWIEVNLAADFNDHYRHFDEFGIEIDPYAIGQPALVYRAEIEAEVGRSVKPALCGIAQAYQRLENVLQPVPDEVTTAKDIFKSVRIRVIRPKSYIISK